MVLLSLSYNLNLLKLCFCLVVNLDVKSGVYIFIFGVGLVSERNASMMSIFLYFVRFHFIYLEIQCYSCRGVKGCEGVANRRLARQ